MKEKKISCEEYTGVGTVVYVARDGVYLGCIIISDTVKDGAKDAIIELKKAGVEVRYHSEVKSLLIE